MNTTRSRPGAESDAVTAASLHVGVCRFGTTSAELQALLGDRLPALQDWMSGQTMGVCPEHGTVVYRSDLERFLA